MFGNSFNRSFNLGTGTKTTISELIETLAMVMNKKEKLQIKIIESTPGDLNGCCADMSEISNRIKFEPQIKFIDGVSEMWGWVKKRGIKD